MKKVEAPNMPATPIRLLDCTLRDGSYAIDFRFTASDTEIIAGALDGAGIPLIEVGHGVGLNASATGKGEAVETDEAYLRAAARSVHRGKFGVFCIPGIARLIDVDLAADLGAGFIRIGTNVEDADLAQPFIERARQRGLEVMANFMKSYAMPPTAFAERVVRAEEYGAEVVYIVDSAGGMLPSELNHYIDAVRERTTVPLGFHGHDNLGLAVAHSLSAVERGVAVIDGSIKGMGRSAGNAPTEQLIACLDRMGINLGVDLIDILDIADQHVQPFLADGTLQGLDVVAGYALFHSSFMGTILRYAHRFQLDPRQLIIAVCAHDKVECPEDLVSRIANQMVGEPAWAVSGRYRMHQYFGHEQE